MAKLFATLRGGKTQEIEAGPGASVMEAIRGGGVDEILAICGGCLSCATCHVFIDDQFLPQLPVMSEDENILLDSSVHRRPGSRLSCQIRFDAELDGLCVVIAPEG